MTWFSLVLGASLASAGMPDPGELLRDVPQTLRLTDFAHARYEAISFFLVMALASAAVVRWLWNALSRDFPKLPRTSYGKSLGIVALWGMLVLVVLTMIAGTRELMTPGSWEKQGLLYRIPEKKS